MIRIAVVSDSHGDFRNVGRLRAKLGGRIDWLLHAGDHIQDAPRIAVNLGVDPSRVRAVAGNCDHPVREPAQQLVEIEGVKILMVHGHQYGVKEGLHRVHCLAAEAGARVVVFGHSHVAVCLEEGGVLLFNPGSITAPRITGEPPSCGLLEVEKGQIMAKLLYAM